MIKAAVLGSPIAHSLSPLLHLSAYAHLEIVGEYSKFEVQSGQLKSFLDSHVDLNAVSLTMPLKEEALNLVDFVSEIAQKISSGNTMLKIQDSWHLTSTDVVGFAKAIEFNNADITGEVLVIGAGATARAVVAACDGISKEIHIISRNAARKSQIEKVATSSTLVFHPWERTELMNSANLVVNTTSGIAADFFIDSIVQPMGTYFEVLYDPWPTRMLRHWARQDRQTMDGIELLVHQGISQVEIFSGLSVDRLQLSQLMRKAALLALNQTKL